MIIAFIVFHYLQDEPFEYEGEATYVGHFYNEHMISYNDCMKMEWLK